MAEEENRESTDSGRASQVHVDYRKALGVVALLASVGGWWASLRLYLDYVSTLKNSDFVASCQLSATVSCAENYTSSYGSLLGFSNVVIGFTAFALLAMVAVLLLSKIELPAWFQGALSVFLGGAVALVSFFQWASFTQIGTLCIYCLLIWSSVIPTFWLSLGALRSRTPRGMRLVEFFRNNSALLAVVHLAVVLTLGEISIGAFSELLRALFG